MLWGQNLIKSSSTLDFSTGSKMAKVWPWNVEIRFGNGEFYGMSVEKNYSFTCCYYYYYYYYYYYFILANTLVRTGLEFETCLFIVLSGT